MNREGTVVRVEALPTCDLCDEPARFDCKTTRGPWMYACEYHFVVHGIGLGMGLGQRLEVSDGTPVE
jgi:hypothetical protein